MKWNHLPLAGGLYDQHPELLEQFGIIFAALNKKRAEEQRRQEAESKRARSR